MPSVRSSSLAVFMLGPFELHHAGGCFAAEAVQSRQTRIMLKVLLTYRSRVVSVDQFIEILWPDVEPERAQRYVYVRMSQLRRTLSPDDPSAYILTLEGGYRWNPAANCWIDVEAFEAQLRVGRHHLERGALRQAVAAYDAAHALYRGDFLAEMPYADWALAERERLRDQYLTALTESAEAYAQQGHYRRALARCREGVMMDSSREALYVRLMLYHYYAGERAQALTVYYRCCDVLAQELGVAPLAETETLIRQIREGTLWQRADAPRYPPPVYEGRLFEVPYSLSDVPFVGREREYAWLVGQWQAGGGGLVLVEGEAGVGKTRLVLESLGFAETHGVPVLRIRCRARDQLPYTSLVTALRAANVAEVDVTSLPMTTWSVLRPLLPEFAGRVAGFPQPPVLSASDGQTRLEEALIALYVHCVPDNSLLFLDDAHWADGPTLSLIPRLALHNTVVLTARSESLTANHPLRKACDKLRGEGKLATLHLSPLAAASVSQLVHRLAGEPLPELADSLMAKGEGNPLFLLATLRWLFEQGQLYLDAGRHWAWTATGPKTLPPTVRNVIAARLRRLARMPQRLFDLIAVMGAGFDFALLQYAAGLDEETVLAGLDSLLDAQLVSETRAVGRAEYEPAHDCYLEVAYDTLPRARRRHLHQRVAEAIAATVGDADAAAPLVAFHYERAGAAAPAFEWLLRAGEAAEQRHAYADAETFYRRAIDVNGGEPAPVYERLGRIAHTTARYADGVTYYAAALEHWRVLDDLGHRLRTQYGLAECYRELSDFDAAADCARQALELAKSGGAAPDLVARGHVVLSNALRSGQLAVPATIRAHLKRAAALAEGVEDWLVLGEATFWLGVVTVNAGDASAALDYDRRALRCFLRTGHVGWQSMAQNNLAYHALLAGRAEDALGAAQAGLALARETGARNSLGWLLSTLGETQLHLGELDAARRTLEEGLALVSAWGPVRLCPGFQHDLAWVAIAEGAWSEAQELLITAIDMAPATAPQFIPRLRIALAEAYLGAGGVAEAQAEAEKARLAAERKQQRSVEGRAWRLIAQCGTRSGDDIDVDAAFERSLELLRAVGDDLEEARTRAAWGKALQLRRDPRADHLLHLARETFKMCRANVDLWRLEATST